MTITEQALVPKNPAKKSEDGIVVTADFVAVIDGSTSKATRRYSWLHSNGRLAMQVVARCVRRMPKSTTCQQFCAMATKSLRSHYRQRDMELLSTHPEERLAASAIVFSRLQRQLWLVGDCQCLVDGELFDNPKPSEQELAAERAAIITSSPVYKAWAQQPNRDITPQLEQLCAEARAAIIPHMLLTMQQQQNKGYSVLDGFPVDQSHVRILTLDFQPHQLVLASDGYPVLCNTLAQSEEHLARQRATDPLCVGPAFMATKAFMPGSNSFDDRAYVRFSV